MDFNTLKTSDAGLLLAEWSTPLTERIRDYLNDDLLGKPNVLNDITYWTGPMLAKGHERYAEMRDSLLRAFVTRNVAREAIEQQVEAIVGLENWQLTTDGKARQEAVRTPDEDVMTGWWDRRKIESLLDLFKVQLAAHGRACIRPVISARFYRQGADGKVTLPPARDLRDALSRIHVKLPDLTQSGIYEDPDTLDQLSVYAYRIDGRNELELSWVLDDGRTVLKILRDNAPPQVAVLPLGGKLWMVEATLPRGMATKTMLSNQDALGVSDTMLNRNTHFAGWVETFAIGIAPPGNWRNGDGSLTAEPQDAESAWQPAPITTGPGTRNFYQAAERNSVTRDLEKNVEIKSSAFAPASMDRFIPVDPLAIQAGIERFEGNIYREARQAFMLMADDATASGRSREVASGSFLRGGEKIRHASEGAVRDLLELVLAIASLMLPEAQRATYTGLRAVVQARVQAFSPSAQERQENREDFKAGGIDLDTYMLSTGLVTDTEAVRKKLAAEAVPVP